ncbi:membrane protein [Marinobacterium nitratireducens]|uniref:Membrane protein n=1 Tax=Marinobacterium nitratireducens TaxID=518897 RepID=A0A917ZA07_9GAMM|nr:hypothetical protein [Marinobacterium nitratireducens]GGO78234.1 membrane protein [Marinobacterium nitratireducens]
MSQDLDKSPSRATDGDGGNARIIYILYLVSLLVGITALIGVVMAYVYRSDAPPWLREHYRWQIRTFWIGILYTFIGSLLTGVGVGFLVLLAVLVWFIVRCVKGLQRLGRGEAPEDSGSWLF